MVAVTQAVPSNGHSVHVHPVDPISSLILFDVSIYLIRHIRSFVNDPASDTIFESSARSAPSLGCRDLLCAVRWRGGVHECRHALPRHDTRQARRPLAVSLAVASAFQLPMDVHIDRRCLELPLAPVLRHVFVVYGALLAAFGVTAVMHDLRM